MSSPGSTRGNPSMGDIVRSVVVIGLIVLGLYVFGTVFSSKPDEPSPTIDYATIADQARPVAGFKLLAPSTLPKGWRANKATYDIEGWHLGILTKDDKDYIGLDQGKVSVPRAIARYADGSKDGGTADIAGETWSVRKGPEGRTTYVRREGGATTIVIGTASRGVIEDFIASLTTS